MLESKELESRRSTHILSQGCMLQLCLESGKNWTQLTCSITEDYPDSLCPSRILGSHLKNGVEAQTWSRFWNALHDIQLKKKRAGNKPQIIWILFFKSVMMHTISMVITLESGVIVILIFFFLLLLFLPQFFMIKMYGFQAPPKRDILKQLVSPLQRAIWHQPSTLMTVPDPWPAIPSSSWSSSSHF